MRKIASVLIGRTICLLIAAGLFFRFEMKPPSAVMSVPETTPSAARVRIIAFGDSLTAGYSLPIEDGYPAVLERWLQSRGYSVEVINSGVSGETSAGGVRRADFIRSFDPDIVLFGLGGNDALRLLSPEEMETNLAKALTILRSGDFPPRVLLIGMRAPANADAQYREAFDAVYPKLAQEFSLPLVPFFLEGVALDSRYTLSDGIHPNALGYQYIVEKTIGPRVESLLGELGTAR